MVRIIEIIDKQTEDRFSLDPGNNDRTYWTIGDKIYKNRDPKKTLLEFGNLPLDSSQDAVIMYRSNGYHLISVRDERGIAREITVTSNSGRDVKASDVLCGEEIWLDEFLRYGSKEGLILIDNHPFAFRYQPERSGDVIPFEDRREEEIRAGRIAQMHGYSKI